MRWAAARFRLALATSATPRNRAAALPRLGIDSCFQSVVDTDRFQQPEPNPEIFQVAIDDLALPIEQCWVMEDSLAGIAAGKAAGIFTVGITTTFDRGALCASGADLVVDSFAGLRNVLKEI